MPESLDRTDVRLLRLLQQDGRISNAALAEAAHLSPATCHRRTQALFESGAVRGVRAIVDPPSVGRSVLVIVGVVLDRSTPESFGDFERAITALDFV
ncbi:MAG: Lrp/AsnC family transcriptional regulator, partial [Rhodospirillales bacterium]|nr:Lrp/AsnC family transcriptional regulator [Rhodospirillales bacterium]